MYLSSPLTAAYGVTKFKIIIVMRLVTLCCATKSHFVVLQSHTLLCYQVTLCCATKSHLDAKQTQLCLSALQNSVMALHAIKMPTAQMST